jgi:hypothetical protein
MNTHLHLLCAAVAASVLTAACGAASKAPEPKLVSTSSFEICPWKFGESGLDVVRDTSGWQQLMSQAKPNAGSIRNWQPNFAEGQRVVVYRLGQKSSAGFAVNYGVPSLNSASTLRLPITQTRPAGTIQASLLTSPCAVALIQASPATGLEIIDSANNAVLATGKY